MVQETVLIMKESHYGQDGWILWYGNLCSHLHSRPKARAGKQEVIYNKCNSHRGGVAMNVKEINLFQMMAWISL